uniref:Uncharacterized protein n=1 Tax=Pipistrellus kuhlii TaxID=59472 RepID=A0A7J8A7P8_PIPKU|nr:hypothetical protein mPipKuh1_008811 [Pipistrellus kuhlii]
MGTSPRPGAMAQAPDTSSNNTCFHFYSFRNRRRCFLKLQEVLVRNELGSEPRSRWPPEGLGWPGLCTLTCLTGMPAGDQVSKPKRHCFRPPGWYGQKTTPGQPISRLQGKHRVLQAHNTGEPAPRSHPR